VTPGLPHDFTESSTIASDPAIADAVRRLRRQHRWNSAAVWCFILFILAGGGYLSTLTDGSQPAPKWFAAIVIVIGLLGAAAGLAARRDTVALRALSSDVLSRARGLAGRRWSFIIAYRIMASLGMLLFAWFGSISVPAVINGAAYLAGAGPSGMFIGTSYDYSCDSDGNCNQVTNGVLHQGGSATSYTWSAKVPLGHSIPVRLPVIQWPFTFPVHDTAEAIGSMVAGLLGVFAFVLVVRYARKKLISAIQRKAASARTA
jgi:hypothetical protein